MRTELVLFGKHFNMASHVRRRRLVLAVYAGFATLMLVGWFIDRWHLWGACLVIFGTSYVRRLVLGGYGAEGKGLLKPFLGNEVHARYVRDPYSFWSRMCNWTIPGVANEREFCNDEREMHIRDNAHEVAYRRLGMLVIYIFMVEYVKNAALPLLSGLGIIFPTSFFDELIYGMVIAASILVQSLPQTILLWNEPDMEEGQ